ncbi:hypothetical protein LWI29_007048 [Acer saccharum]|uniref:RNase H type-1 domain-containing protein n=1 Tax=Acer saccharum TaxID=4024 RepID=A0AA39W2F6_ACESA|nr:hypothetical protein LWI29_007048 [Acer saccharum]
MQQPLHHLVPAGPVLEIPQNQVPPAAIEANEQVDTTAVSRHQRVKRRPAWMTDFELPPPYGSLKHNSDAAVKSSVNHIGVGVTIRDWEGNMVAAMSMPLGGFFEPEPGEFLSVREGLLLSKRLDLKIDWVELDAVHVASAVNYVYVNDGLAGVVLDDIRTLCREVGVSKCLSIPRQGNEMAHSLAARAFFF